MPLKVHFLNVGRGDCTIIEFPSGRVGMVDIDHLKVLDEDTRLELSQEVGISLKSAEEKLTDPLDYYDTQIGSTTAIFRFVATHPDMDHLTGLHRLHKQEYAKLDFSHLGVRGIDTLPTPLHNKR